MLRRFFCVAMIWVGALALSGCGAQPGKTFISFDRGSANVPPLTTVDKQGLYALFPGDGVTPLAAVYLQQGDRFGFESHEGKVMGVYIKGTQTQYTPLDAILSSEYVWKYQGDKQP